MPKSHYDFSNGPAQIDPHSVTKHEVLVGYLIRYFEQRTLSARGREKLRITLVDGFCGGGLYTLKGRGTEVLGSPLRMLQAVEEARVRINANRKKPVELDVLYVFVDKDAKALAHLKQVLLDRCYGPLIGSTIHLVHEDFVAASSKIFQLISGHTPQARTALFFLDQYGYSDVPAPLIREIFRGSPKSEVVLTFHVSAFATYTNDQFADHVSRKLAIDIRSELGGSSIERIKEENSADWRRVIQAALYQALVRECGARYFTPFFIRGEGSGQGEYWLVHLSQHPRAQDVMKQVHWQHQNHFVHYGGPGLNMLEAPVMGFRQEFDGGFVFDEAAHRLSSDALPKQLAKLLFARSQPIQIGEIYATTCNTSPGTSFMYKEALVRLLDEREIFIRAEDGKSRWKARYMNDTDWVERSPQKGLFGGRFGSLP